MALPGGPMGHAVVASTGTRRDVGRGLGRREADAPRLEVEPQ